jgi:hypothetical protein
MLGGEEVFGREEARVDQAKLISSSGQNENWMLMM